LAGQQECDDGFEMHERLFRIFLQLSGFAGCVMLMIHKGHFQINTSRNNNEQRGKQD